MQITHEQQVFIKKVGIVIGGIVALGLLAFFIILQSVPGNPLYAATVNGVEEAVEYIYFTPTAKANYDLKLMDRRLGETETLAERSTFNQGDTEYLFAEANERAYELLDILAAQEGQTISREESLMLTHKLLVRLRAIEDVAERSEGLDPFTESIQTSRREIAQIFDSRANQLVAHGTNEEVTTFLNGLLNELLNKVEDDTMSADVRKSVERAVKNAEEDISDLKIADAIGTVSDALRLIDVEEMIGPDPEQSEEETPAPAETASSTEVQERASRSIKIDTTTISSTTPQSY